MHDLKDLTHDFHYENYRTEYIKSQKNNSSHNTNRHQKSNEEADRLLQQKEIELKRMQDLIAKMKHNMSCSNSNVNNNNNNNSNPNNNPILLSFGNKANLKNLNTQGNHLISRHINNSYNNNNYQTEKQNAYIQNLSSFQNLTNSTPI